MTVDVNALCFSYDKSPVLEDASLKIACGDYAVIFGPNGGGKTTFLKLLIGGLKPTGGTIALMGQEPAKVRDKLGYVPQVQRFDRQFPISVLELVLQGCLSQLRWWGSYPPEAKDAARAALAQVDLLHKEKDAFGTLSGGEMQRALIARALVGNPEILLLDEATAHVDQKTQILIYDLLLKMKGKMTILMVTHDLQPILEKATRLVCINRRLTLYAKEEMCGHFALGLYHPPPPR